MDRKEEIRRVDFDAIREFNDVDYMDDEVAFLNELRELPFEAGCRMQMDMFVIVACLKGKLKVTLNGLELTVQKNEVVVAFSGSMVDDCLMSPDFSGAVLCLSQKSLLNQGLGCDLWDKVFQLKECPVISVKDGYIRLFSLYGALLREKAREKGETPYHKEIMFSIVKAALYELLSSMDGGPIYGKGLVKQREVLFRRFVELLSGSKVKQRSVTWYADQLCISPKYLSTVCKQVSGKTAFDWINEYVEADIRYWLKSSTKSIKEVANLLNFPNLSFFGKYCRMRCGVSPTELRRQLRGQQPDNQ